LPLIASDDLLVVSLIRYLVPSGKEDGTARELREDDEDEDVFGQVVGQVVDAVIRNGRVEAWVMRSSPLDRWRQMKHSRQMQRDADERVAAAPAPANKVRLPERFEELRLLSSTADARLLSSTVDAGLYSKLESGGTFNIAEKVLPLADDLKRLSTAKYLLNVPANLLALGAVVLLGGEFALIAAVPDDNAVLLSVQVVTGLLAGGGAVILLATSFLVRGMSLAPAHDNGVELSTVVVEGAPVVGVCNGVNHPAPDDHPADGKPFYCNQHVAAIGWWDESSPPPCDDPWMTAADERAAEERAADERAADERAADEETAATKAATRPLDSQAKAKWLKIYAHLWIRGTASQWAVIPPLIRRCPSALIREVRKRQRIAMTWRGLANAALNAELGVFSWQPLVDRLLSFMPPAQNTGESFAAALTCREHKMLTRVRLAALAARPEGAFWSILELVAELAPHQPGRCARLPVAQATLCHTLSPSLRAEASHHRPRPITAAARAEWRKLSWEQKILTEACGGGPRVGPSRAVDGTSPAAKAAADKAAADKAPTEKVAAEELRRRATALGLLQVLTTASIADDATLKKSITFCDEYGITSVSDMVEYNLVQDFVRHLGLKTVPGKKLLSMLQTPTSELAAQLSDRLFSPSSSRKSSSATTVEPSVEAEEPQNLDAVSEPVAEAIFKALSA
jgi:hypothetical protein